MRIEIMIDDQLYQQAVELTGLTDEQMLEEALRLLIQSKKQTTNTAISHFQASVKQNYRLGELLAK
jgi:Arc/MetJ family transcription regulator